MRVTCSQCSATLTLDEAQLEDGPERVECANCGAESIVDTDGRSFDSHAALAMANDETSPGEATHAEEAHGEAANSQVVGTGSSEQVRSEQDRSEQDHFEQEVDKQTLLRSPSAASSDAHATIPLPSLQELGLNPLSPTGPAPAPPRGSIPDADLEADDHPAPSARYPVHSSAPPRSSQHVEARPSRGVQRVTVSIPVPPVQRRGWAWLGGAALVGLAFGALLSAGSPPATPFDTAAARAAVQEATRHAIACFESAPQLQGTLQLVLRPDGEVSEVGLDGAMTKLQEAECMRRAYSAVEVPPFAGPPVRLERTLALAAAD